MSTRAGTGADASRVLQAGVGLAVCVPGADRSAAPLDRCHPRPGGLGARTGCGCGLSTAPLCLCNTFANVNLMVAGEARMVQRMLGGLGQTYAAALTIRHWGWHGGVMKSSGRTPEVITGSNWPTIGPRRRRRNNPCTGNN
jgi:hypothetical protein